MRLHRAVEHFRTVFAFRLLSGARRNAVTQEWDTRPSRRPRRLSRKLLHLVISLLRLPRGRRTVRCWPSGVPRGRGPSGRCSLASRWGERWGSCRTGSPQRVGEHPQPIDSLLVMRNSIRFVIFLPLVERQAGQRGLRLQDSGRVKWLREPMVVSYECVGGLTA